MRSSSSSTTAATVTIAVTAPAATPSSASQSFDRAGGSSSSSSHTATFSSTIPDDSTKQTDSYASAGAYTPQNYQERVNPFDKNTTSAAAASTIATSAPTSQPAATFSRRTSGSTPYTGSPASVIQQQPTGGTSTGTSSFDRSAVSDYTSKPMSAAPAPVPYATKSYARTDSAFRRDFRSNSISAHSEYSHSKPTAGLSGSPLYSTMEEQPKARPAATAAPTAAAPVAASPAAIGSQASRSDAFNAASQLTRSIGSFSDAELIFGGTASVGGGGASVAGTVRGPERFSSSTDSSAVFRAADTSAPPAYKIYDGIQNHAFQDYDATTSSAGGGSLAPSREEDDDEYDLK